MKSSEERLAEILEKRKDLGRHHRLWVRNDWREFPIFEVPVESLALNVDNRRFTAEKMWAEAQLGRSLDPESNPSDERSVESLLLDSSHRIDVDTIIGSPTNDYLALKTDWLRRKQETPLWIRPDGTVRNGNRRLAMIKRLQREQGDTGLRWVQTVILDALDVDEGTLLEMEQHEQLTDNFKVRYNDIDYLLALREAATLRGIEWFSPASLDEVAGELQTMADKSKSEVLRDLYAIKYMDAFLEDSQQEGQYHRLLRTLERFRDVGRMMQTVEQEYSLDASEILQTLFAAIRAGTDHLNIRQIRTMFKRDRDRFDELASQIQAIESREIGNDRESPQLGTMPSTDSRDEDDDGDEEAADGDGPIVPNYPKAAVANAIKASIDGFRSSQEQDAILTLREILNRIRILATDIVQAAMSDPRTSAEATDAVREIASWAEANRRAD